jgi:hypothetical protein
MFWLGAGGCNHIYIIEERAGGFNRVYIIKVCLRRLIELTRIGGFCCMAFLTATDRESLKLLRRKKPDFFEKSGFCPHKFGKVSIDIYFSI